MAVVGNFIFLFFLRLMWDFLDLESERGGSICWPNNKIIDNKGQKNQAISYKKSDIFLYPRFVSSHHIVASLVLSLDF